MIILIEGINPEPWRAPKLGTKRAGGKVVPIAYKDEGLRSYQEAIAETVRDLLNEHRVAQPIFTDESLRVEFHFWRQTESYQGVGRRNTRSRPDVTNMVKALEDALQGVIYANDQNNVRVVGNLVDIGPDVEPAVMILLEQTEKDFIYSDSAKSFILNRDEDVISDGAGCWIVP